MYNATTPVDEYEANTAEGAAFRGGRRYNHFVAVTSTADLRATSLNTDVVVLKLAD